jgi:hypothetical protein
MTAISMFTVRKFNLNNIKMGAGTVQPVYRLAYWLDDRDFESQQGQKLFSPSKTS